MLLAQVSRRLLRRLRRIEARLLRELGAATRDRAHNVLRESHPHVPVASGSLLASGFVDGPEVGDHRVQSNAGYAHPHAGAIHEGFHWGGQTIEPPHFMRKGAEGQEEAFRRDVLQTINAVIKE
jgi:hypothetical protein